MPCCSLASGEFAAGAWGEDAVAGVGPEVGALAVEDVGAVEQPAKSAIKIAGGRRRKRTCIA